MTDHEAIRRLIARQAQLRDDDRIDDWIEAYEPDATFTARGTVTVGRDAIKALADSLTTGRWKGLHLLSEPVVTIDGDTAVATTDFVYVVPDREGGFSVKGVARYTDELRRHADAWRYRSRDVAYR